jgi:hypothetical protein
MLVVVDADDAAREERADRPPRARRFRVRGASARAWELAWLRTFLVLLAAMIVMTIARAATHAAFPVLATPRLDTLGLALAVLAWALAFAPLLQEGELSIGEDGAHLRWRGRARFVGAATIKSALVVEEDLAMGLRATVLRLFLRDGGTCDAIFAVRPRGLGAARARGEALAALAAVRAVLGEEPSQGPEGELSPLLGREGAKTTRWIAQLRARFAPGAAFRDDVEGRARALLALVIDGHRPPATRAAAAVALASLERAEGRKRLAAIATGTASPTLRAALEATSRDDDQAIGAALEALEAEAHAEDDEGESSERRR